MATDTLPPGPGRFRVFYTVPGRVGSFQREYSAACPDDARTAFRIDHAEQRPTPIVSKVKRLA